MYQDIKNMARDRKRKYGTADEMIEFPLTFFHNMSPAIHS